MLQVLAHPLETIRVSRDDLYRSWQELNSADDRQVDIISLGNPHFSLDEFKRLAQLCAGHRHAGPIAGSQRPRGLCCARMIVFAWVNAFYFPLSRECLN